MYNMRNVTLPLSPCDSLFETIIQLVYKRKIVCGERQWTVIIRHVQIGRSLFFFLFFSIQIVTKKKYKEYFLLF